MTDALKTWNNFTTDLMKSMPVATDCCYFSTQDDAVQYQLFGFCDASTIAYVAL